MGRLRGSHRGRASSGVARDWDHGPGSTGLFSSSASTAAILGTGLTPASSELTVMRTRGIVDLFLDGTPGADGAGFFGAIGIGKCTLAAFTAGIVSIPTPITEVGWDGWLWHSFFSVHHGETGLGPSPAAHQRIEIDSKAMRKFDAHEVIYMAIEQVLVGTAVINCMKDSQNARPVYWETLILPSPSLAM